MPRAAILTLVCTLVAAAAAACQGTQPTQVAGSPAPAATPRAPRATPTLAAAKALTFDVAVRGPADLAGTGTGAATPWADLAGAQVSFALARTGRALPGVGTFEADAAGKVAMAIAQPAGPLMVTAAVGKVRLMRFVAPAAGGVATVDPSTTIVAAYFRQLRVEGQPAVERMDVSRLEGLATTVRAKLEADAAGADLSSEAAAAGYFAGMLAGDAKLAERATAAVGGTRLGEDVLGP